MMQMSSTDLFIFVEGVHLDRFFYSRVIESIPNLQVRYEIVIAEVLPGKVGGKQALLKFFSFLRKKSALTSTLGINKTSCIFFLDKDVDDIQRKKKRSQHVVYTEHYDAQNYIFLHGDLLTSAASVASVDPRVLQSDLADASAWCQRIAQLWKKWICICLCVTEYTVTRVANYGKESQIQISPCQSTDETKYNSYVQKIARRYKIPTAEFKKRLKTTSIKVDKLFTKGEHHRIFKGKWFSTALADDIERIMGTSHYNKNGLKARLESTIAVTLECDEPWANHFKQPVLDVVSML